MSAKATPRPSWPPASALIEYFHDVRAVTHLRLDAMADDRFDGTVQDEAYGLLTVRLVWAGVATSCAWHGGQIAYYNRLLIR